MAMLLATRLAMDASAVRPAPPRLLTHTASHSLPSFHSLAVNLIRLPAGQAVLLAHGRMFDTGQRSLPRNMKCLILRDGQDKPL